MLLKGRMVLMTLEADLIWCCGVVRQGCWALDGILAV